MYTYSVIFISITITESRRASLLDYHKSHEALSIIIEQAVLKTQYNYYRLSVLTHSSKLFNIAKICKCVI